MSFGWSVGDIFTAVEIIYECSNALRTSTGSPEDRIRANEFLSTFQHTITVVQQIYGPNLPFRPGSSPIHQDSNVPPPTEAELSSLSALKSLFESLKDEIVKYAGMTKLPSEEEKNYFARQAQKLKWHFFAKRTIQDLKEKITAQVTLLQPALAKRQFSGITLQASLYHEETTATLDDLKTMLRVLSSQIANTNALPPPTTISAAPTPDPNEPLSRATTLLPSPDDFTAYTTAAAQVSPFVPILPPPTISTSIKSLRVSHPLRLAVKTWLTTLSSPLPSSNILWLLDSPPATQCSAIVHSVLTALDRPVLSFSASHINLQSKNDIPPDERFRDMLYSFLSTLLNYLTAHPEPCTPKRIDAPSFAALDGSADPASLSKAIMLLGNLLDNLPIPCVVIVDNAQFLDKPPLHTLLREFLGLFARRTDRVGATFQGSHKVLLTTRGMSGFLGDLGLEKGLSRCATKDGVLAGSAGYVLWDEVWSAVRGLGVRERGRDR